jgi:predicted RNA binding protein YcfA (HicA-like mRNA interferase family)
MPRKIRELKADLRRAGFIEQPGKGSHAGWRHPLVPGKVTLSGNDGDDAQRYQERDVRDALAQLRDVGRRRP